MAHLWTSRWLNDQEASSDIAPMQGGLLVDYGRGGGAKGAAKL